MIFFIYAAISFKVFFFFAQFHKNEEWKPIYLMHFTHLSRSKMQFYWSELYMYFLFKFHLGCNIPLHIPRKRFWIISYSHRKSRKWNLEKWMHVYYKKIYKEEVLNQISRGKETWLESSKLYSICFYSCSWFKFFLINFL